MSGCVDHGTFQPACPYCRDAQGLKRWPEKREPSTVDGLRVEWVETLERTVMVMVYDHDRLILALDEKGTNELVMSLVRELCAGRVELRRKGVVQP